MDKFRALTIYAKSLVRHLQGSGELLEPRHLFYEAERVIKKNGWEKEAYDFVREEVQRVRDSLKTLKDEYIEYYKSGEKDEVKEQYFRLNFHKLGIDGEEEIKIKNEAKYGEDSLTKEELNLLLQKRKEEDKTNALIFIENQVKLSNGEDFDTNALKLSAKKLKEHGLYNIILKILPVAVSCYDVDKIRTMFEDTYFGDFRLFLY